MLPLIDADVLCHEIGWSAQFKDKETGEEILFDFDKAALLLDEKIKLICMEVGATQPPILFLSASEELITMWNRVHGDKLEFVPNFRYAVAVTRPYKGNRKNPKPFHFYNLQAYMLATYQCVISQDGYEADDEMSMAQFGRDDTIICSRDKDLRITPGWHYSWECGGQYSIGPSYTDPLGSLEVRSDRKTLGYGLKFFYYQLIVGDTADYIPGLPGCGDAFARQLLEDAVTERDMFEKVQKAYKEKLGDNAKTYFREQADLLWMTQIRGQRYVPPPKES